MFQLGLLVFLMASPVKALVGEHPGEKAFFKSSQPKNGFKDLQDLIRFSCDPENQKLPAHEFRGLLALKGAKSLLEKHGPNGLSIRKFQECLFFFQEQNRLIPKRFRSEPSKPWVLVSSPPEQTCRFRAPLGYSERIREIRFDSIRFLGVSHLAGIQDPTELGNARTQIQKEVLSGGTDAVLIEGREMGQPLGCEGVLKDAFTPDPSIRSESTLVTKKAFFSKVAIIPADNQFPDPEDRAYFPDEAAYQKARSDMIFMDILSRYQGMLRKVPKLTDPLGEAIRVSCQLRKVEPVPDANTFKLKYALLNRRGLPSDPNQIHRDIEPASMIQDPMRPVLGTNTLKDATEPFRNQSIIKAIQISQTHYKKPTVVFGSGHLAVIGPTLESKSKRKVQIPLPNACK